MRGFLFLGVLSFTAVGCSESDAEKLRKVGDKTFDRAAAIALQTWDELSQTSLGQQPPAPLPDLTSKVQGRIHWDRDLAELAITVSTAGDVVTLSGNVKSKEQKEHALSLANGTAGVGKVTDQLTVLDKPNGGDSEKP